MAKYEKAGAQRAKDQARAADLKRRGVVRTSGRCPLCHRVIELKNLCEHLRSCR